MKPNTVAIAKVLDSALNMLFIAVVAGIPLFFLPNTTEPFFINKHLALFGATGLAVILWTAGFVLRRKVSVTVSPLLLPLLILSAAAIASVIINKTSIIEAAVGRTGLFASLLIMFFVGSSRKTKIAPKLVNSLIISATILALISVLSFTKIFNSLGLPAWMSGKTFTPAGDMMTLLIVLVTTLPLVVGKLKGPSSAKATEGAAEETTGAALAKLGSIAAIILILSAAVIAAILVFPGQPGAPTRLSLPISWQIAVETLKVKPLLGVGPANYLAAYTQFRPITVNSTPIWNQRFQLGPNEPLHTFTELGLVGLLALLFLSWSIFNLVGANNKAKFGGARLSLLLLLASLLIQPFNVVTITLLIALAVVVALEVKAAKVGVVWNATLCLVALQEGVVQVAREPGVDVVEQETKKSKESPILAWIIFIPAMTLGLILMFLVGRTWAGEFSYRQVLEAIVANDGLAAYNQMIKTLNLNPYLATYHRQYADINLRLANALASQKDLSDQDRNNVSQLVQQAIREGKLAAQLNPDDVRNWETLAAIYRSLINVAQGAQDWTIVTYTEAIRRDPVNPILRIELGGVFYNARDWESAIRTFQAATNLKPDYANAYYNLALANEQDGRPKEAVRAMQAVLQTLDANSPDYPTAQKKLEELIKKAEASAEKISEEAAAPTGNATEKSQRLSQPEPNPTPLPGANRVELGEESAPPVTPSPTGEPTATPTL